MDTYAMYYIHEDEIGSVAFDVWAIHNNWSPDGVWSDREYCEIPVDRAWVSAWAETEGDVLSAKDLDFTLGMSWDTNYVYTYIAKGLIHRAFPREKRGLRGASASLFPPASLPYGASHPVFRPIRRYGYAYGQNTSRLWNLYTKNGHKPPMIFSALAECSQTRVPIVVKSLTMMGRDAIIYCVYK